MIGGLGVSERTSLSANLLDMRQLRRVGRIDAEGTGGSGAGLIVLIPYAYSVSSMKAACKSIAERVGAYVTGKPQAPPQEEPRRE